MKVERDIAGITVPFAAGLAVSIYAGSSPAAHMFSSIVIISLIVFLTHPQRRVTGTGPVWSSLIVLMLFCGYVTGSYDIMMAISDTDEMSATEVIASDFCTSMRKAIDSIPFSNAETGEIIKALITGERRGIPEEIAEAFRESGASHVLALSGLHLGIIYGIVRAGLSFMGNSTSIKNIRSILAILICGFYTLATGAGASISRAFLFIAIGEYAAIRKIRFPLSVTMMASMTIQLCISPSSLKAVGFQLSYAAIAGIAFIFPTFRNFWPGDRKKDTLLAKCTRWIWDSAAMSIACQITTGPIAYYYFRSFPMHFILTNLMAIPLVTLIIPAALVTLACSYLGWDPPILIRCTEWLTASLSWSLETISDM